MRLDQLNSGKSIKQNQENNQKIHNNENKSSENSAQDKDTTLDCQAVFTLVFLFGSGMHY